MRETALTEKKYAGTRGSPQRIQGADDNRVN